MIRILTTLTVLLECHAVTIAADGPLSPLDAARSLKVPVGFRTTLFAGEPDVVQPIAFTFDGRGRLWVVECLSYPDWTTDGTGRDRVIILEDVDGDGAFDRRKVFLDRGVNLSGIELGFGGVWLCSAPGLVFVPDRNGDDIPDGEPETLLDGWSLEARHNAFNGLTWGPDGWLYGLNGILSTSSVGRPGTPDAERVTLDCGVWRYHPTRREFEVVAWGTTNPWGLDFDDFGQMFITNCVIKHIFHVVPGAHFVRMYGQDLDPRTYELMKSCADHIHWAGGFWDTSIGGKHLAAGGGHAHVGAMIYLGDNWPASYRNTVFMHNLHGRRVNRDRLERHRSGYVVRHGEDILFSTDPWYRGLELRYGPDGGVFLTDWNDTGECHDREVTRRETGRIFKVTFGEVQRQKVDIARLGDGELVALQLHANDWYVRQARLELARRADTDTLGTAARPALREILQKHPETTRRLRALWALHAAGGVGGDLLAATLGSDDEYLRAWAIHLELEDRGTAASTLARLAEMARSDPSALVRLYLAAGLQRLPLAQRWTIAAPLARRHEDRDDANIPLMLWYGIEPLLPDRDGRDLGLLRGAGMPLLRELIARRLTAGGAGERERVVAALAGINDPRVQGDILRGMYAELRGLRDVPAPAGWSRVVALTSGSPDSTVGEIAEILSLIFGDLDVTRRLRQRLGERSASVAGRRRALRALVEVRAADLAPLLQSLLVEPELRGPALRGLAVFDDPATPRHILECYASLDESERQDAVATLASRPTHAVALLDAVQSKKIPLGDISAFAASQIRQLKRPEISARLNRIWGRVQETSAEKRALIAHHRERLTPEYLQSAERSRGRKVFVRECGTCHRLFDDGGAIGPDLTGSQRENVDFVLENIIDPGAVVPGVYQMKIFLTTDGRLITGIVAVDGRETVTVQTLNEKIVLRRQDIVSINRTPLSIMPEGLMRRFGDGELRDLVAYLAGAGQVPLPGE